MGEAKGGPRQVSSIYLHFPFCKHLCNYCDFYKTLASHGLPDLLPLHQYLESSMEKLNNFLQEYHFEFAPLETFYIGGGTPSLWGPEGARFLEQFFHKHQIKRHRECEFTMEVNPGSWTPEGLEEWIKVGVNRFSIGLQALSGPLLRYLDRHHSVEESLETLEYFQRKNLNFSVDFMLGLPHSEKGNRDILKELEEALKSRPKHLSLYILTTKGHYPLKDHLPSDDFVRYEYLAVSQYLREKGYRHYEVSNFALPGYESRHNLKYWEFESVAALGKSATGLLVGSDEEAFRFKWETISPQFSLERLGKKEIQLERSYLKLRTNKGFSGLDFFGPQEQEAFFKLVQVWENLGYLEKREGDTIKLSPLGYLMMDGLMGDLFREIKSF